MHTLYLTRRWHSFTTKSVFNTDMILKPFIKQHWHIYCGYIMRLMWSIIWLTLYCNMKIMHNLSMGIFGSAHIFPFILLIHHLYSKQLPMTLHHGSFWKLLEAYFNPLYLWCGAERQKQSNILKSSNKCFVFGDQIEMNYLIIVIIKLIFLMNSSKSGVSNSVPGGLQPCWVWHPWSKYS